MDFGKRESTETASQTPVFGKKSGPKLKRIDVADGMCSSMSFVGTSGYSESCNFESGPRMYALLHRILRSSSAEVR